MGFLVSLFFFVCVLHSFIFFPSRLIPLSVSLQLSLSSYPCAAIPFPFSLREGGVGWLAAVVGGESAFSAPLGACFTKAFSVILLRLCFSLVSAVVKDEVCWVAPHTKRCGHRR